MTEPEKPQTTIAVDGAVFRLAEDTDVDELARSVAAAARSGAEFVTFQTPEAVDVRLLITSISSVSIATQQTAASWEPIPATPWEWE
ncbi:hypothetical protein AB0P19_05810 [Microbacterium oleivorans]|uniref:Uncharacterized protein n=1 Tax=Microbacterium gawkjiense TaxID=3067309 RepID=A0ABU3G965_9MICO|nr:hypothetical protein [Microbacterium sp. KSW4-11]MDT3316363.1 hypothetical protein [Microbacterium sp. KSW4-11]